jgi:uncharacterized linocin/CFP29 family protein
VRQYPDAIAQALGQLRLVGVNGPYSVLLGADAYTALAEASDNGYPVLEHIKKLVKDDIIWAPAIGGAFVLTTRGGDFSLHIGQDVSIGYSKCLGGAEKLLTGLQWKYWIFRTWISFRFLKKLAARSSM